MKKNAFLLLIGLLLLVFAGCEKTSFNSNSKVELYLISSFSKMNNTWGIDESSVITKSNPLIEYSDFLSYNPKDYTFELTSSASETVKNLDHSVFGLAFAIKADESIIYTGYFWPSYSSASCDWIVIDPLSTLIGNKLQVRLGYPGLVQGQIIPDKRNDIRILRIFKRDNKLK